MSPLCKFFVVYSWQFPDYLLDIGKNTLLGKAGFIIKEIIVYGNVAKHYFVGGSDIWK